MFSGEIINQLDKHKGIVYSTDISSCANYIVTGGDDNIARVYSANGHLVQE